MCCPSAEPCIRCRLWAGDNAAASAHAFRNSPAKNNCERKRCRIPATEYVALRLTCDLPTSLRPRLRWLAAAQDAPSGPTQKPVAEALAPVRPCSWARGASKSRRLCCPVRSTNPRQGPANHRRTRRLLPAHKPAGEDTAPHLAEPPHPDLAPSRNCAPRGSAGAAAPPYQGIPAGIEEKQKRPEG